MRTVKVASALVPLVLLVGCGGGDVKPADGDAAAEVAEQSSSATPSPSESATAEALPSDETLRTYFEGISSTDLAELEDAVEAAQPKSLAAAYAIYQRGYAQAAVDGGNPFASNAKVEKIDGGYRTCETADEATCYEFKDIEGADGKVANFTVNGKALKGRLTVGNGKAIPIQGLNGTATFISAFETTSSHNLIVVFSVKSAKDTGLAGIEATYRSPDGRQSAANYREGPTELASDSLANFAGVFPNAKIGGTVTVKMYDESFNNNGTVTLRTR